MTFRTSWQRILSVPLHPAQTIPWIVVVGLVAGGLNYSIVHVPFVRDWISQHNWYLLVCLRHPTIWCPYIMAGAIRVSNGISAFSGKPPSEAWPVDHEMVIALIAISYVIVPTILLWGLKSRKKYISGETSGLSPNMIQFVLALSGCVLSWQLLVPIAGSPKSWAIWQRMKDGAYKESILTGTKSSVSSLALRARVLHAMPEVAGGGPWSASPGGITLSDMQTCLTSMEVGIWPEGVKAQVHYIFEIESPDSMTIWGIADEEGTNQDSVFVNKDGRTGRIQVHAGVNPNEGYAFEDHI